MMIERRRGAMPALAVVVLLGACATARFERSLDPESRDFYSKVRLIITAEERKEFQALPPEKRKDFIAEFWAKRDPTPFTPENEYKDAYFQRIKDANHLFSDGPPPGWLQDRGRIYVTLGPPDYRETYPRGVTFYGLPTEIWWYGFFPIVFVDEHWTGDYRIQPLGADQIAEINRAQVHWNEAAAKKPKPPAAALADVAVEMLKNEKEGNVLRIAVPYRNIWLKAQGSLMRAELELALTAVDAAGAEAWKFTEKYPLEVTDSRLREVLAKTYEIRVPVTLGPGKYKMRVRLTNLGDGSKAEIEKDLEI
jgi:GWxTD domain-containing protein